MPIIATAGSSGEQFTKIETGSYSAVCAEVIDLGLIEEDNFDKTAKVKNHKIAIVWELDELRDDGKRFVMSNQYKLSLHEKSSLRKTLDAWRGVNFTEEQLQGFDVETVIGANCILTIVATKKKDGSEGRKIGAVSKPMKGNVKLTVSADYVRPKFITDILNKQHADNFTDDTNYLPTSDTNGNSEDPSLPF